MKIRNKDMHDIINMTKLLVAPKVAVSLSLLKLWCLPGLTVDDDRIYSMYNCMLYVEKNIDR